MQGKVRDETRNHAVLRPFDPQASGRYKQIGTLSVRPSAAR